MCLYTVKGVSRLIQRRADVVQVKLTLMGRFVFCVGFIVCGGQGREIVYFLIKI